MSDGDSKRTKVGFISPATYSDITPSEFLRVAPDNIDVTQVQMRLGGMSDHTMDAFDLRVIEAAVPEMTRCAVDLADVGADLIIQFGVPFSLIHGEHARDVQQELSRACRKPVIMAGVAMLDALDVFDVHRIAVAAGYFNEEWTAIFRLKLMQNNLQVPYMENWISQDVTCSQAESDIAAWDFSVAPSRAGVLKAGLNAQDAPALFALGDGVRMLGLAEELERETGKIVIGADIALYWRTLQKLKLKPRAAGFGRLLGLLG
jgi:maleate cis-trans isomerase